MKDGIVIKNASCLTMDEQESADWIAIDGGKIRAVGSGEGYKEYVSDETKVIDAHGCSVLPGFVDSHFHTVITGISENFINLEGAKDFKGIGKRIKSANGKHPGKLIVAHKLDCDSLAEKRFPDRTVLDKYCNDAPVAIYVVDYHALILNTYGILHFKIPFTLNGVDLDKKGMPTGIFTNQAGGKLDTNIFKSFSDEDIHRAVSGSMDKLLQYGLTTVAAMEGGNMSFAFDEDHDCEFIYHHKEKYPISLELFYQTTDIDCVMKKGLKRIGGALYLDGTLGRRTAALSVDYCDAPGQRGLFCIETEYLKEFVALCYEKDLQVALDAIGDAAIEEALSAFEYAVELHGSKDCRWRIEHAELITSSQMKRAEKLGVILSMQPTYEGIWGGQNKMYHQRLGERYKETNQFREILDHNIIICGGSDSDITDPNPLMGIHYAINHPVEAHRVTLKEAIKMYTYNGAYGLFKEKEIGSLTPGKDGDIVILDRAIESVDLNKIKSVQVAVTIKAGKILFDGSSHGKA